MVVIQTNAATKKKNTGNTTDTPSTILTSFSKQINFIGHALIFSKFLSLLSLALTNYSNPDEPIQNNERTCIVIIVVSLFFSFFIV